MPRNSLKFETQKPRAKAARLPSRTFEILFIALVGAACVAIVLAPAA